MNITMSSVLSGILFGCIGMWMFAVGKKRTHFTLILIAMALMIYPYFTNGPLQDWGIGAALCGAAFYFWDT